MPCRVLIMIISLGCGRTSCSFCSAATACDELTRLHLILLDILIGDNNVILVNSAPISSVSRCHPTMAAAEIHMYDDLYIHPQIRHMSSSIVTNADLNW